jgi:hypothetical protein
MLMCSLVCAVTLECIIENQYHSYPSMKRFVLALRSFSSFYFHCFSSYICNLLRMNQFIYFCFLNLLGWNIFSLMFMVLIVSGVQHVSVSSMIGDIYSGIKEDL